MGVISEEYLEKVRQDTRRGLRGAFERKLATGGTPYGYRSVPIVVGEDADGHPRVEGYRLEVDPEEAPVVVRLFEGYALQGLGLRTLAHALNREGVPGPRKGGWAPTGIRELLRNPIYRGERIWNRSVWVKDHETGRRHRYERPESEWVRQRNEEWRIVSDELWEAAQTARGKRNEKHERDGRGRIIRTAVHGPTSRRRLLSGFLACGECGGSFHALTGSPYWGCAHHRNRGTCSNGARIPQAELERAVVGAVREALDERVAEEALRVALEEVRRRINAAEPHELEAELQAVDEKLERGLDLALEHGEDPHLKRRLRELRAERGRLSARIREAHAKVPTVEELMPRLRARVRELEATLKADLAQGRLALGTLLGEEKLRVYADGRVEGTALLRAEGTLRASGEAPRPAAPVVAGVGFEPTTSGL